MLERLRRHPLPIVAHFRHSLVLTFAFPQAVLEPLVPRGLALDTFGPFGFAAVALVQTERLRPAFMPARLGTSFFLSGYRVFVRQAGSSSLRGLFILRSDTDRRSMARLGNVLTHYGYRLAAVAVSEPGHALEVVVRTPRAEADLHVVADLSTAGAALPPGSPFDTLEEARRYAGPLPYTFGYEASTGSLVVVRAVRTAWEPRPVHVEVQEATFFGREPFAGSEPILANAFHVADVDYRWERAVVVPAVSSVR
ncbi:MAG: DUF2071 domain-containing protein [Actinomycetota bacterium]|nr:DUF2071 domain-containing protein [Actinomycetota bacterium]